jgi:hypothetical protein
MAETNWRVSKPRAKGSIYRMVVEDNDRGRIIAYVEGKQAVKNAALMAVAPDLIKYITELYEAQCLPIEYRGTAYALINKTKERL